MNSSFARRRMVDQQIRAWDVFDPAVLQLFSELPRDHYVPEQYRHLAYADTEIPLGHGEKMMTPIVEGRLLQALDVSAADSILEIGTGSGFLTACLARLGASVASVDIHEDFVAAAADRLAAAGIENVDVMSMDATRELPQGKFDAIAVTGSTPVFDERYYDALNPGGRLFVVVGDRPVMEARLLVAGAEVPRSGDVLFETELAPLLNAARPPPFIF